MAEERLQKIIAAAGLASRRKAEELITSGVVQVNGHTITELGAKADASRDDIRVNGQRLRVERQHLYIMLNKPKGYVTTTSDPEGRPTVMDLVQLGPKARGIRLYPVGRLDFNSEGLLLLTNDGAIAHKLTHASSLVPKTYMVKVSGTPEEEGIDRLRHGVSITTEQDPKKRVRTAPARIRKMREADNPWYEVTLIEGRNRQIRKMFEEIGHHVEKIRRVRYGPLHLNVEPGRWRLLAPQEVRMLRNTRQLRGEDMEDAKDSSRRNRAERFGTGEYPQTSSAIPRRSKRFKNGRARDDGKQRYREPQREEPQHKQDPKDASRHNRAERFRTGEYPQNSSAIPRGKRSGRSGPTRGSVRGGRGRRG